MSHEKNTRSKSEAEVKTDEFKMYTQKIAENARVQSERSSAVLNSINKSARRRLGHLSLLTATSDFIDASAARTEQSKDLSAKNITKAVAGITQYAPKEAEHGYVASYETPGKDSSYDRRERVGHVLEVRPLDNGQGISLKIAHQGETTTAQDHEREYRISENGEIFSVGARDSGGNASESQLAGPEFEDMNDGAEVMPGDLWGPGPSVVLRNDLDTFTNVVEQAVGAFNTSPAIVAAEPLPPRHNSAGAEW